LKQLSIDISGNWTAHTAKSWEIDTTKKTLFTTFSNRSAL